jgi:hypothetical protein
MKWTIDGSLALQNLDIIDGSKRICMIDCENESLSDSDILANARLIAAAPDLLAALETALPWLIKADIDGAFDGCALPLGGRKAWEQIERAIAKAKGN